MRFSRSRFGRNDERVIRRAHKQMIVISARVAAGGP